MVPPHSWGRAFEDNMSSSRSETELTQFPDPFGTSCTSYVRPCIATGTDGSMQYIDTPFTGRKYNG